MVQVHIWVLEVQDGPWCIEGSSDFKEPTDVSGVSNSVETARMDHGNGAGTYLGTEAMRQHSLERGGAPQRPGR